MVNLYIKSVKITEYADTCGILHSAAELPRTISRNEAINSGEKPIFEKCISLLPSQIQNEIIKTDQYLKSLKPLKFKRQIEKNGNKITYVASEYGLSYAIYLSNDIFDHSLQWYIITSGKSESWHRKADMMEETLKYLAASSPDIARRMFQNLSDCVGCNKNCLVKTHYQFEDKHKMVCHGKLKFKMSAFGFKDVYTFIEAINNIVV